MTTLLFTLGLAFGVILIALAFLGIGWLLTGKARLCGGACGRDPTKKEGDKSSCQLGCKKK
jgi:hypothetical protein